MKIAMPTAEGRLCRHFGHCERFAIVTADEDGDLTCEEVEPPPHEPGALPRWLRDQGVDVVIASGMGRRAQMFFEQFGVRTVVGAEPDDPLRVARAFLDGTLAVGPNVCDH